MNHFFFPPPPSPPQLNCGLPIVLRVATPSLQSLMYVVFGSILPIVTTLPMDLLVSLIAACAYMCVCVCVHVRGNPVAVNGRNT